MNEKDNAAKILHQSPEIERERNRIIDLVREDKQRRDQETAFFRGENLITYTEVGKAQFIGHRRKPEWKKDYQYNVFDPITRDKVMAIVSKAAGLYEAQFFNKNKRLASISQTIATVLGAFYKDSTMQLKERDRNKLAMIAGLTTPKVILYEGWRHQMRSIREIEERDPETGEVTKTKLKKIVHYNGPWSELVPVQDFVPASLKIRDMQEQHRVTWLQKMSMDEFKRMYPESKYPEARKVLPYGTLFDNDLTEFTVRNDLKENEVEVPITFEKFDDKASIIANGILLTKINSPMPFAHKDNPFVWGGFEELDPHFVYDMPLTIKLLDMQDVSNEVLNLTLDMVWRALNEVILVGNGDGINEDELYGGGLVPVDNPKNFNKFEFGSNFGFTAANVVMNRVKQSIEGSSVDATSSGQAGSGRPVTAREVLIAREAALEIASLFLQNMESMERDKAFLRVKNQLDRYKRPIDWKKRLGEEEAGNAIATFREISVRDAKLDNGKRGTVNINITASPRSQDELNKLNIENDKELSQTIDISPEFIRDIEFDVEIVANSSVKKSKALEVAEAKDFMNEAKQSPDLLNAPYAAREYVKALGKPEDEALAQPQVNPIEQMLAGVGGGGRTNNAPKPAESLPPETAVDAIMNEQL